MPTFVADASVTSNQPSGDGHPLHTLRESLATSRATDLEPPRKRQRTSKVDDTSLLQEEEGGTYLSDFVLATVVVTLHSDCATPCPSVGCLPICITSVDKLDERTLGIGISARNSTSLAARPHKINLESDTFEPLLPHLLRIRDLFQTPSNQRSVPAWASCKLVFPHRDSWKDIRLEALILWRKGVAAVDIANIPKYCFELISTYLPDQTPDSSEAWTPNDFYGSVFVPPRGMTVAPSVLQVELECDLYPFQQRAVDWLVRREKGMSLEDGDPKAVERPTADIIVSCFRPVNDSFGRLSLFSSIQGLFLDHMPKYRQLSGGILAEEMGLGKTVELLALITLNQRSISIDDYEGPGHLAKSGATLIITPPHILQQWQNEISRHAPNLKAFIYTGLKANDHMDVEKLLQYDIILTTYNILSREIHYAEAPPERNLRHNKQYKARRSPLVQISWWRVCLDEAQMIESGVTKAAIVARLIPRVNAWAVTGTPLKKNVEDLYGLLLFLNYEPFCNSKRTWNRVDKAVFKEIFSKIALRHTKDMIRQELRLPPQKRVVITIPFTAIEEQNYSQLVQQMCDECGLTPDGAPAVDDVDFESPNLLEKMRGWLRRLRQTCLHPQVGGRNRRALGRGNGPLKTVDEVLGIMIEQNETNLRAEQRQVVLSQVRHAHIIANDKSNPERWGTALRMYKAALEQATGFVDTIREELAVEREKMAPAIGSANGSSTSESGSGATNPKDSSDGSKGDSSSDADTEEKQDKNSKLAVLQKTLRAAIEVRHVAAFFVGTAYFQLKSDESRTSPESEDYHHLEKLETEFYDDAKSMRKEMLREWHDAAQRLMRKVRSRSNLGSIPQIPPLQDFGGIESRKFLEKLDDISEVLDRQALFVAKLREKASEYLLLNLVDEDEGIETTGDEYEDSTKKQDELYAYITALRAAVADRHRLLTGQSNYLTDSEVKDALKLAKEGEGHAPELFLSLVEERKKFVPNGDNDSFRAIVSQIRATATALQWQNDSGSSRAGAELGIIEHQLKAVQQVSSTQLKLITDLERDVDLFTKTMNQRLEFYRQLQGLSDQLSPWKEELDETLDLPALQKQQAEQAKSEHKLSGLNTKRRYLTHLQHESTTQNARICVICQTQFDIDLIDITFKDDLHAAEEEQPSASPAKSDPDSPHISTSIYSGMNATTLKEIKSIDLNGSYGTKIDTIARHLLWIREHDPGSKSLIFSQFGDFLQVLGGALRHYRIGYSSSNSSDKSGVERFKRDPSVEVFLLDAKSESSGLNLVSATHVFLCEPLLNTALELQAIGRVHRIGQQRPTTVYQYVIAESVEESIYELATSRRMAHMSSSGKASEQGSRSGTPGAGPQVQENILDSANTLEMQQAPLSALLVKGRSGGEVVESEDLWNCLFGKARRRPEKVSGEMAREVDRFLRAEAAESRGSQAISGGA